jgi:hypothetical protein
MKAKGCAPFAFVFELHGYLRLPLPQNAQFSTRNRRSLHATLQAWL